MAEMTHRWAGRWGILFLEMTLIVLSILIAFALDAWWDEQIQRREEGSHLESLRDELIASRSALGEIIQSVQQHGDNVDTLVGLLQSAGSDSVIVSNELLGSVVSWRTSDVSISTLESLSASGNLGIITNPGIRKALIGFPAVVQDVQEDEEIGRDFVEYVLSPALARLGLAGAAYANRLGFNEAGHGGESAIKPTEELIGLLTARQVHISFSKSGLPRISAYMSELITKIDSELQERR